MTRVLLLGATTPLGRQLLLKLAVAGHEVIAHLPAGAAPGETGDFASQVAHGDFATVMSDCVNEWGCETVIAAHPLDEMAFDAVRRSHAGGATTRDGLPPVRWLQCAPHLRHTEWRDAKQRVALEELGIRVTVVRHAPCFAEVVEAFETPCLVGRWGLELVNPIHEGEVAAAALRALADGAEQVSVGGPETLSWRAIARLVAAARGRRAWIVPWPSFAARAVEPYLAPISGRRTLADYVRPANHPRVSYATQPTPSPRRLPRGELWSSLQP